MTSPGGENLGMNLWVSVLPTIQGLQERFRQAGGPAGEAMGSGIQEGLERKLSGSGSGMQASAQKMAETHATAFGESWKRAMEQTAAFDIGNLLAQRAAANRSTLETAGRAHAQNFLQGFKTEASTGGQATMLSSFEQLLANVGPSFRKAAQGAHRAFNDEMKTAPLIPTVEELGFQRMLPQLTQTFGGMGKAATDAFHTQAKEGFSHTAESLMEEFLPGKWGRAVALFTGLGHDMGKLHADAIAEETKNLGGKLVPTIESVNANVAGKMAEAGELSGKLMMGGMVAAVAIGAEVLISDVKNIMALANKEIETFWNVGKEGADSLMEGFKSVLEGKAPDIMAFTNVIEEGFKGLGEYPLNVLNTGIDNTVGRIPILGEAIKSVAEEGEQAFQAFFTVFDEGKQLAGAWIGTLLEIGNTWTEVKRTIVGQALIPNEELGSSLDMYVNVVRDISSSGALVWFEDVAKIVGELNQRLVGLSDGAGLTKSQLTELAKTVAEGNEVLGGIKINVDNLTAAFNDFDVGADETTEHLNTLINISRLTGANINEMTTDLDAVAPSLKALGYGLDESAFMMGKLNQELGKPAMNRLAFGVAQIEDKIHNIAPDEDVSVAWGKVIQQTQTFLDLQDHAGAVDYLKNFVGSSRTAETLVEGIKKHVVETPEALKAAMDAAGEALHQPLDMALDASKTLDDAFHQLGNQAISALAPLGIGVMQQLEGVTNHVSEWLEKNQSKVIGWAGTISHWVLNAISSFGNMAGNLLVTAAPAIDGFIKMAIFGLKTLDGAMQEIIKPLALLPSALGGDFFKSIATGLDQGQQALAKLANTDIEGMLVSGGHGLEALGAGADALNKPLDALINKAQTTASIEEAFKAKFTNKEAGATEPAFQEAISGNADEGLKLLGDSDTWKAIKDQMAKLGIGLDVDDKGNVTKITAKTEAEADALKDFLKEKFGEQSDVWKDLEPKLNIKVAPGAKLTPQQVMDGIGIPSELQGPEGIKIKTELERPGGNGVTGTGGAPGGASASGTVNAPGAAGTSGSPGITGEIPSGALGAHPSAFLLVPGQVGLQPAAFNKSISQVQDSAGIPIGLKTPTGISIPTGLDMRIPQTASLKEDVMDAAGIPDDYQGDVKGASPGVSIATGLDVRDSPDKKTPSEVMDAAGVPAAWQGTDGLIIPAGFDLSAAINGGGGGGPAGNPGTATFAKGGPLWDQFMAGPGQKYGPMTPGSPGGGGGGGGGVHSVNWDAIAGAESSGNWQITHGEGPDVTGGLQIATATWRSHGGSTPKAYMASKEEQIAVAERILADPNQGPTAWPKTYHDHPEWFGTVGAQRGGLIGFQGGGNAQFHHGDDPSGQFAGLADSADSNPWGIGGSGEYEVGRWLSEHFQKWPLLEGVFRHRQTGGSVFSGLSGQGDQPSYQSQHQYHSSLSLPSDDWIRGLFGQQEGGSAGEDGAWRPFDPFMDFMVKNYMSGPDVVHHNHNVEENLLGGLAGRQGYKDGGWVDWITRPQNKLLEMIFGHKGSDRNPQRGPDGIQYHQDGGTADWLNQNATADGGKSSGWPSKIWDLYKRYVLNPLPMAHFQTGGDTSDWLNGQSDGSSGSGGGIPHKLWELYKRYVLTPFPMAHFDQGGSTDEWLKRNATADQGNGGGIGSTLWNLYKRYVLNPVPFGFQDGGAVGDAAWEGQHPRVSGMQDLAKGMAGIPYSLGPTGTEEGNLSIDCSALVGTLISNYLGTKAPDHRGELFPAGPNMYTGNEAVWLKAMGFTKGIGPPGSIQVGFENDPRPGHGGGHTDLRLPNGVAVEASSRKTATMPHGGVRYGGDALDPNGPPFTDHWYMTPRGFIDGGHVQGEWTPGRDSVPMTLEPGTFVVNRNASMKHRGLLDRVFGGSSARGSGHGAAGPGVRSILEVGERLIPPPLASKNLGLLHTINSSKGFQAGGVVEAEEWAQFLDGQKYDADSYLDCSGYTSSVWGVMTGVGPGRHWNTMSDFASMGFKPGHQPGAFNISVRTKPGNEGHMIAQLPNGVVIESGGKGIVYGSSTPIENNPELPVEWYYPVGTQNDQFGVDGGGVQSVDYTTQGGGGGGASGGGGGGGGGSAGGGGGGGAPAPYATIPPPEYAKGAQVPAGQGVQTPYGNFDYTFNLPPDKQALFTPDQRQEFDKWLDKYSKSLQSASDAQDAITKAQQNADKLLETKTEKDEAWQRIVDSARAHHDDPNDELLHPGAKAAREAAEAADRAYDDAVKGVTRAKERQSDNATQAQIDAEGKPPWAKDTKQTPGDPNAEQLGKGLVQGIFQELGFPDVFGKPITEWGIWKLAMGGLGYGAGLMQNMTQLGPGNPIPGATGGGAAGSPGGGGNVLGGLLSGIFPGVDKLFNGQNNGTAPPLGPAPVASTGSALPGQMFNAPGGAPGPGNVAPAGYGGGGGLTVHVNNNPFVPTPAVSDTIRTVANFTTAPQMSGGAPRMA